MAAKRKPLDELSAADLGLSAEDLTVSQAVVELTPAEPRKAGEIITDDGSGAARIAEFLAAEKVI
jgi:electron transfer flavoprotein beta subunit